MKALKYTVASFFTFFLVLVLIVACISGGKSKTEEVDFEGGNTRDLFVAKAIDEYNAVNGAVGGDKYRKWYTGSADGANWCATFVSWIADRSVLKIGSGEAILKTPFKIFVTRKVKKLANSILSKNYKTLHITMPLTPKLFIKASTKYWIEYGNRNGITKEQMDTMSIEDDNTLV